MLQITSNRTYGQFRGVEKSQTIFYKMIERPLCGPDVLWVQGIVPFPQTSGDETTGLRECRLGPSSAGQAVAGAGEIELRYRTSSACEGCVPFSHRDMKISRGKIGFTCLQTILFYLPESMTYFVSRLPAAWSVPASTLLKISTYLSRRHSWPVMLIVTP